MAKTKASKRKATKRPARAATKKKARRAQPRKKAASQKTARKASPQKARRSAPKRAAAPKRAVKAAKARPKAKASPKRPLASAKAGPKAVTSPKPKTPVLQRERRRLPDAERLNVNRDMSDDHMMAAAQTGRLGLKKDLEEHTETSPALTAGDVDAKWEDAYSVGDEAPGGDNPTPDQDRVDDIGKALGVTYQDNEELQGGDEITERDAKRWELDPASSDDWPHKE